MAARTASLLITTLAMVIALSSSFGSCQQNMGVSLYWGQKSTEAPLKTLCDTGLFGYINLAYLTVTQSGTVLKLKGHCDSTAGNCYKLASDIHHCQSQGVKVLVSIKITGESSQLVDANELADNIAQNYLLGKESGPFGIIILDGVDFHVESPASHQKSYWKEVAQNLADMTTPKKILLTASPQCYYPDETLDATIQTGLINYVLVQFYNNPTCDYSGGIDNVLKYWKKWSSALPGKSQLFMGLPTDPKKVDSGYIPPQTVALCVLPQINPSPNYKGLMLYDASFLDISNALPCKAPKLPRLVRMCSEN